MKIRALIGFWLIAMLGLAMCGAGLPDIGLSSGRGKMDIGLKTSLNRGGGGAGGPWRGHKLALVIVADDGTTGNKAWSAAADSLKFRYTLTPSDAVVGGIDAAEYLTSAELAAVAALGPVEVGSTGVHHRTNGIKAHIWTNAADYEDSLYISTTPAWVEAITGTPPRTWCTDLYQWSWIAAKNVRANGYRAVAGGAGYNARPAATLEDEEYIRGVIENNTVGWDRFDPFRFMPWDDVGSPYAIGAIPAEDFEHFLSGGHWRGKAGGYNLPEVIARGWPIRCQGDPQTVVGLPIDRLAPLLRMVMKGVEQ